MLWMNFDDLVWNAYLFAWFDVNTGGCREIRLSAHMDHQWIQGVRRADVSRIPLQFHTRQVVMEIVTGPIYFKKMLASTGIHREHEDSQENLVFIWIRGSLQYDG